MINNNDFKIVEGYHVCSIYKNKEEQFEQLVHFFEDGLKENQKCLYIVDENTKEEISDEFKRRGLDIQQYINSGQFVFLTKNESYVKNGDFDPDAMIALLKTSETEALAAGYSSLRLTGEMTWILGSEGYEKKAIEYENKLNTVIPTSKISAICQYNENKFNQKTLIDVIQSHPFLIIYGKKYENKYFYNSPTIRAHAAALIPPSDYQAILKLIIED